MGKEITISYFKTRFGELILGSFEEKLCLADWRYRKRRDSIDKRIKEGLRAQYVEGVVFNSQMTLFANN